MKCHRECELGCSGPSAQHCYQQIYRPNTERVDEARFQQGIVDFASWLQKDEIDCASDDVLNREFYVTLAKRLVGFNEDVKMGLSIIELKSSSSWNKDAAGNSKLFLRIQQQTVEQFSLRLECTGTYTSIRARYFITVLNSVQSFQQSVNCSKQDDEGLHICEQEIENGPVSLVFLNGFAYSDQTGSINTLSINPSVQRIDASR